MAVFVSRNESSDRLLECHSPRVPIEVIQIALHVSSFLRRQELGGAPGRGNLSTDYIRRTDNLHKAPQQLTSI